MKIGRGKIWKIVKLLKSINIFNKYELGLLCLVSLLMIASGAGMPGFWSNFLALTSLITGCVFIVLVAKGSLWNYPFGLYNAASYAYIVYIFHEFGNVILFLFFFVPMLSIGWIGWYRNRKDTNKRGGEFEIKTKRLTCISWAFALGGIIILTCVFKIFLKGFFGFDEHHVWLDSFSIAVPIITQILMNLRYQEQWYFWCLFSLANIVLWGVVYSENTNSLALLISWIFFLGCSVYGHILWKKESVRLLQN